MYNSNILKSFTILIAFFLIASVVVYNKSSETFAKTRSGNVSTLSSTGSCQCDLWSVVENGCGSRGFATCTAKFSCSCIAPTPETIDPRIVSCTDTDGGYNPQTKGTVTEIRYGTIKTSADTCSTSTALTEFYCDNSRYTRYVTVDCSTEISGGICNRGACVAMSSVK